MFKRVWNNSAFLYCYLTPWPSPDLSQAFIAFIAFMPFMASGFGVFTPLI